MPCRPVVPHLWPQTPRQRTWSLASLPLGSTSFDHAACLWRHPLTKTVCPPTVFVLEKVANSDICEFLASRAREQRFNACRCALTHSFRTDAQERAIRFMLMVAACMLVARLHVGCPLACWLKHISKYSLIYYILLRSFFSSCPQWHRLRQYNDCGCCLTPVAVARLRFKEDTDKQEVYVVE